MSSEMGDLGRYAAIEFFLSRLIAKQCLGAKDPQAELDRWAEDIAAEEAAIMAFVKSDPGNTDAVLNALRGKSEIERLMQEATDIVAAGGVHPLAGA